MNLFAVKVRSHDEGEAKQIAIKHSKDVHGKDLRYSEDSSMVQEINQ